MTVIAVPYHLDEHLPDLDLPFTPAEVVSTEFPAGQPWERLAVLYDAVADTVAADAVRGRRPVVLTGDCAIALGIVAGLQRAGADPGLVWFDAHDSASGGPNRHTSAPSGAVSSHRTGAAGSPARLSAYGSVRCASQAMCLRRGVSGKSVFRPLMTTGLR